MGARSAPVVRFRVLRWLESPATVHGVHGGDNARTTVSMLKTTCAHCGRAFSARRLSARFCSTPCRNSWHTSARKLGEHTIQSNLAPDRVSVLLGSVLERTLARFCADQGLPLDDPLVKRIIEFVRSL